DADAELLSLLLEETAGAGGARLVHRKIDNHAFVDGDELGVLSANLEDGIDGLAAERGADVDGARLVGSDLVVDGVGADELGDQLAAGASCADAADIESVAPELLHLRETLLGGFDWTPGRPEVHIVDHRAHIVDDDHIGRDGADVEPEIRR